MNKAMELVRRIIGIQEEQTQQGGIEFIIDPVEDSKAISQTPQLEANCTALYSAALTEAMSRIGFPEEKIQFQEHQYLPDPKDFKTVWIYNISKLSFALRNGSLTAKVPACEAGQEYTLVTSLPEMYKTPKARVDDNEVGFFVQDGKRMAQDLINPNNLGLDQDAADNVWSLTDGCNFNQRGVFWSTHNPPLKSELKSAHKRLRAYYQGLQDRANIERSAAVVSKKLGLPTEEVRAAEKYLTQETQ
jgi:hypothetical protein